MNVSRIYTFPEDGETLRKKSEKIKRVTIDLRFFTMSMYSFKLRKFPRALGIAAPQVGHNLRVFIIDTIEQPEGFTKFYYNPRIVQKKKPYKHLEGCLSLPGEKCEVERFGEIEVEYLTFESKLEKESLAGLNAAVFQHELDHLNGILIGDSTNA